MFCFYRTLVDSIEDTSHYESIPLKVAVKHRDLLGPRSTYSWPLMLSNTTPNRVIFVSDVSLPWQMVSKSHHMHATRQLKSY